MEASNGENRIVGAFAPPEAVLFVGAGISFDSGAPGFKDLRDFFLLPVLGRDTEKVDMRDLSPEQIFDLLDDGRPETRRSIRRALWVACEAGEPNPNHFAVSVLASEGAKIWTPNFDTLIERAAARSGIALDVRTDPRELAAPAPLLNKVHGSFPFTGDPPSEPAVHDYALLFTNPTLWNRLDSVWSERLAEDIEGRDLYLFGYRGADLDIVPALLDLVSRARYVEWWDLDPTNLAHVEELFDGTSANLAFREGNPSSALRALAAPYLAARGLAPVDPPKSRFVVGGGFDGDLSAVSRANVLGLFDGSRAARKELAKGVVLGPRGLRGRCAWALTRSAGYDIRPVGEALAFVLSHALRVSTFARRERLWVMYAAIVDALPLRHADGRDLARLAASPFADRADLLVRIASKRKRQGDLSQAEAEADEALRELRARSEPHPFLEAMVVYNLLWIRRQRFKLVERDRLYAEFNERLPHVGFNWAGWITIEEAAARTSIGRFAASRELLASPRMTYARAIGHPTLLYDADLAELILDWSEDGINGIATRLSAIVERTERYGSFAHVNSLLLSANLAAATGDGERVESALAEARQRARGELQKRQADLVEAVALGDAAKLDELTIDDRFALIAETAKAIQGKSSPLVLTDGGPLPALF